eukprot:scaffold326786_cov19-Prasinocladus_malaysianus.AAC.1
MSSVGQVVSKEAAMAARANRKAPKTDCARPLGLKIAARLKAYADQFLEVSRGPGRFDCIYLGTL